MRKGVQRRPIPEPKWLRTLSSLDLLKYLRRASQKNMRVIETVVNVMKNNVAEIVFVAPFLANTAPNSLK